MSQIPTFNWSFFWKMPVSPESRALWYRLFHRKLYSQSLLSRFDNGLTSSQCKFCSANTEDLQHLFVRCPMKWRVWIDAFNFLVRTSLSLKTMYAQFSGLFSSLLLLTTLSSGLSAAVCFPLSGVSIGDLLLTAFLL